MGSREFSLRPAQAQCPTFLLPQVCFVLCPKHSCWFPKAQPGDLSFLTVISWVPPLWGWGCVGSHPSSLQQNHKSSFLLPLGTRTIPKKFLTVKARKTLVGKFHPFTPHGIHLRVLSSSPLGPSVAHSVQTCSSSLLSLAPYIQLCALPLAYLSQPRGKAITGQFIQQLSHPGLIPCSLLVVNSKNYPGCIFPPSFPVHEG